MILRVELYLKEDKVKDSSWPQLQLLLLTLNYMVWRKRLTNVLLMIKQPPLSSFLTWTVICKCQFDWTCWRHVWPFSVKAAHSVSQNLAGRGFWVFSKCYYVVFVFYVRVQVLALALASMRISNFFFLINLSKLVSYYHPFILMI